MRPEILHPLMRRTGISPLLRRWRAWRGEKPATIVMYHAVENTAVPYGITAKTFEQQIRFLAENYSFIPLREVPKALRAIDGVRRLVITFDDAFESFIERAHPVLEKFSVPATVFVPTGYVGKSNDWDSDQPGYQPLRVMTATQLRSLAASTLIDIGSHTVSHVSLRGLPLAEMRKQLRDSRIYLEQLLGHAVELFAYPYGQLADFSSATSRALQEEGFKIAVTTRWGSSNSAARLLALRRIFFNETDTTNDLRAKVEGEYDWLALKERIGFVLHPRRNQKARMRTEDKSRIAKATSIH